MAIDLHTHSTASDGTVAPADLMVEAAAAGLSVVALTDHDTTAGWDDAAAALPPGLTLVPGAEISCVYVGADGPISVHLLALLFDRGDQPFAQARAGLRESRSGRGRQIVDKLRADDFPIDWAQVERIAGGAPVGRPHIARALVASGAASDVPDAFARLLFSGSPYYVRKVDLPIMQAIALVRAAGGVPVFAHPFAHRRGRVVGDEVIEAMTAAGLAGIEVDHPDHDDESRAHAARLAARLGLIGTGSSDYHGTNKTTPIAACTSDPASYAAIVELATGAEPIEGSRQ